MKKLLVILPLLALLSCTGVPSQTVLSHFDWTEPADPQGEQPETWNGVEKPLVTFGSTDIRYPRATPCADAVTDQTALTGWRGEKVSAQAVVSTPETIDGLTCTVDDFVADNGAKLAGIARARFVKYVVSDRFLPDQPCGARPENNPAHLEADLLDEAASLDVRARSTRPVWITVDIPRDAAPGRYTAPVAVKGKGIDKTLTLCLNVTGRTLPAPSEWTYHLDLWQHPAAVARAEGVEVWSDEHFERMRPTMRQLADAGQKVITATLNKDPWNNQCYDAYADMIVWTRLADGTWEYDFTVFDRWVQFMLDLGIGKYINCYSMLPWNNMLHYKDAVTGEFVDVKADPGTPAFREMWGPFLPAFVGHLREKGWLGITNIAMDERSPEVMAAATALLKEVAPELGIALADNHDSYKRYPQLHDICVSARQEVAPEDIAARRAAGQVTTYYVCCSHRYPNMFTFSDPAEATVAAWYAVANGYDGFLRWAYNSWVEDPIRDSRFRKWAAGDTYIVYPEGRSSIRFERLREGIQDYEKIRILRGELASDNTPEGAAKRAELEAAVRPFEAHDPARPWPDLLRRAKETVARLSE